MAEYKNIWYTDGSEPVSAADVSYRQAVSTGDALNNVWFDTPIVCTSLAQQNLIFPDPKQNDRVWRADLGQELMWFDTYDSSLNPNGIGIPGWYTISNGLVSVRDAGAYTNGTSTTLSDTGKLSFVGASNIYFPEAFLSLFTTNYKIVVNITNSSTGAAVYMMYMSGGLPLNSALYLRTNMVSETTTVSPPASAQSATTNHVLQGSASFRNCYAETTVFGPTNGNYVRAITESATSNFSTNARVQLSSSVYNSSVQLMDGFMVTSNGTQTFDGSVQVFGYK